MAGKPSSQSRQKGRKAPSAALFRESLHDTLTQRLRNMILQHELKPGEWIQELELCQTLGVSRTPMRESLKVLAAEKLVTLHPYRGASVTEIDPEILLELFEVQSIIESQAGVLACGRAAAAEIDTFRTKHAAMIGHFEAGRREAYFALNQELHCTIVSLSGNDSLIAIHGNVMEQISRARFLALDFEHRWEDSIRQHVEIHDALVERRADAIAELIRRHVLDTGKAVVAAVTSALEQPSSSDAGSQALEV